MHCTLFNVTRDGTTFVGYNFDWFGDKGKIWFIPRSGDQYGYFITTRFGRRLPYEGMNEHGLYVSQTAVPVIKTSFSFLKKLSVSTGVIIKILQGCRSVDDAVRVFKSHSIVFGTFLGFAMLHFMVVEPAGKSAVIEFISDDVKIIPGTGGSRVMTNFYVSDPSIKWPNPVPGCGGYDRHEIVEKGLTAAKRLTADALYSILKSASVRNWEYDGRVYSTLFSNVHNLNSREINLVYNRNFDRVIRFQLDRELGKGPHYYRIEDL